MACAQSIWLADEKHSLKWYVRVVQADQIQLNSKVVHNLYSGHKKASHQTMLAAKSLAVSA